MLENSISTAHWLPDTKKIKNRIIVKFVHRDTREKVYKKRASLMRNATKDLPSVTKKIGKSIQRANKIYISESLTSYRNRLFSRIHKFRKSNKFKFLWTVDGKICLRESKTSVVYKFTINSWRILKISGWMRLKSMVVATFGTIYLLCFFVISIAWL